MNNIKSDIDYSLEEQILHIYPPDLLDDIFKEYFKSFLQLTERYFRIWSLDRKEFEGLTVRKREIAKLFAITLSDTELFVSWFKQLPYLVSKVFDTIVWEGKQTVLELNNRTKGDILQKPDLNQINRDSINPAYCLFILSIKKYHDFEGNQLVYLELPVLIRKKCKRHLPKPKGYYLKGVKSLEPTKFEFSDKGKVLDAFSVIREFINQGHLEVTKNGMFRKHSLSRLSQQCGLEGFSTESSEPALKLLRIELVAFYIKAVSESAEEVDSLEFLKRTINQFTESGEPAVAHFLDHVKGWYHASKHIQIDYNSEFVRLIKELPIEKWVSIRQLNRYRIVRDYNFCTVETEARRYLHISGNWEGWGNKRQFLSPRHFHDLIVEPLLIANLFLFASFGLLNIRYDSPRERIDLPDSYSFSTIFDGLKYIQLTSLGAYVLGLSDSYQVHNRQDVPLELFLDGDRLLITLTVPDPRIEMLLEQMAKRIGRLRFKVDFESFLRGCNGEDELGNRINQFSTLVAGKIPCIWRDFLDDIKKKTESLKAEDEIQVYKIDPNDKELIDLLATDDELRSLVLLAEDYRVLVSKRDIAQYQKRLRIFGYLF